MLKIIYRILGLYVYEPKDKRVMWVDVPMTCKTRDDKDKLISSIVIDLERKIKII